MTRKEKKAIKNIRYFVALFGYDLSNLTDEQIKDGVIKCHCVIKNFGVTCEEAANALYGVLKWRDQKA